jgi:hypothetical protein
MEGENRSTSPLRKHTVKFILDKEDLDAPMSNRKDESSNRIKISFPLKINCKVDDNG